MGSEMCIRDRPSIRSEIEFCAASKCEMKECIRRQLIIQLSFTFCSFSSIRNRILRRSRALLLPDHIASNDAHFYHPPAFLARWPFRCRCLRRSHAALKKEWSRVNSLPLTDQFDQSLTKKQRECQKQSGLYLVQDLKASWLKSLQLFLPGLDHSRSVWQFPAPLKRELRRR